MRLKKKFLNFGHFRTEKVQRVWKPRLSIFGKVRIDLKLKMNQNWKIWIQRNFLRPFLDGCFSVARQVNRARSFSDRAIGVFRHFQLFYKKKLLQDPHFYWKLWWDEVFLGPKCVCRIFFHIAQILFVLGLVIPVVIIGYFQFMDFAENWVPAIFWVAEHFGKFHFSVWRLFRAAAPRILGIFVVFLANLGHLAMDMYQNRYFPIFYQYSHFPTNNFIVGTIFRAAAPRILGIFGVFWANLGHLTMVWYQNQYLAIFYQCSHLLKDNFVVGTIFRAAAPRVLGIFVFFEPISVIWRWLG